MLAGHISVNVKWRTKIRMKQKPRIAPSGRRCHLPAFRPGPIVLRGVVSILRQLQLQQQQRHLGHRLLQRADTVDSARAEGE